jgi:isoleucyl-tRNA synthetase
MFQTVEPHPDFSKMEEEILRFWEEQKIFTKTLTATEKGKPFTFYDGPPFATGLPHYGHILASTIKDLVPRYQTMNGRFVRRRWGWDCHGLPIEEIVERKLKISGKKQIEAIGIKKFNETCRSMVLEFVEEWGKMVRRMGRWVDFENSYKTMDRDYMESVWWGFKQIYEKDLVYEGRKVLLYCPRCETPVSNFEVAMDNSYQDVTEEAVTVKFKVKDQENTYLLAWTTTPWTLPGNVGLAVGKNIVYVKIEVFDFSPKKAEFKGTVLEGTEPTIVKMLKNYFILAKERLSVVENKYKIIKEINSKDLVGWEYEPLFVVPEMKSEKSYKVYAADFVNTEEGTGIVHTAVVYGEDDYNLGLKEGLPVVPLLDEKGVFNDQAPELVRGKYFKDSEQAIRDDLAKRGLLFKTEMHQHSYPHCWRCGTMLYYNAIPAWFINIQKIKKKLLASNKKEINWFPEHLKFGRYAKSVEAAPDWNISRNRYWGNPIPVWKCDKCGQVTVIGSIKELKAAAISGFSDDLDLHRPYIDEVVVKCAHCGNPAHRTPEIFDSWVEAASMPFAEYHYPFENKAVFESRFPAQFVAEYIAQTRAWFYVMHVVSEVLFERAPFENVVTTGTILAEDGSKMSKSKNNYPDPWLVIEKYGVDSLRFYLMSSAVMQADNLNFNEGDLASVNRKVFRILWNVYNYFVTYANEAQWQFDPKFSPAESKKSKNLLDQWINIRLQELINNASDYYDRYDMVRVTRELEKFIDDDLSTWYLRRSRGRQDNAFFATFYRALIYVSKLLAPVAPYTAEHIYQNLHHPDYPESVHLDKWPEAKKLTVHQDEVLKNMSLARAELEKVHAERAKAGIPLRQPLSILGTMVRVIVEDPDLKAIVQEEANVREVRFDTAFNLNTEISDELKIAGLTRVLERQINQLRKEAGLKIGQRVDLAYRTDSAKIKEALTQIDRKKTYIENLTAEGFPGEADFEKEVVIEGDKVGFQIKVRNQKF